MPNFPAPLRRFLALSTAFSLVAPVVAPSAQAGISAPPARVGQVAAVTGTVAFNGAGSNGQWVAATPNYPVTTSDSLATQAGGQVSISLDSSHITLAPNSELQITQLDDTSFVAAESQGEVFLTIGGLVQGQDFTLNTPRGLVTITQNGQYDIAAGDASTPTIVAVFAGGAAVGQTQIPPGQQLTLAGTSPVTSQTGPIAQDPFVAQMLGTAATPATPAAVAPVPIAVSSAPAVVPVVAASAPPADVAPVVDQMSGADALANNGTWDQSPQYGAVWYPAVQPGWVPYRDGHWAFIPPWGWTWIADESWGFAPFHYGRWVQIGPRWGWAPAPDYVPAAAPPPRPVYAPALVSFVGIGVGVTVTAALLASHNVGWVPLAPGEPYYPPYQTNPDYVRNINRTTVRNVTVIDVNHPVTINYINRGGATYIDGASMARGVPVRQYGHPLPPEMLGSARPLGVGLNEALPPHETPRPLPVTFHPAPFHNFQSGAAEPLPPMHPAPMPGYHPLPTPVVPQGLHPAPMPGYHPLPTPAFPGGSSHTSLPVTEAHPGILPGKPETSAPHEPLPHAPLHPIVNHSRQIQTQIHKAHKAAVHVEQHHETKTKKKEPS
jgi:hypothetical protein